jgi:DNA-binding PadR family transcriptional regulator
MPAMETLNATAACILGLLELGPTPGTTRDPGPEAMTGWQIFETASRSLVGFWNITRSQVYLELPRLAEAGLVEDIGQIGPRASRPYRITPDGRQAFLDWLVRWAGPEPRDDQLRSPLLLTVFFGDYLPNGMLRQVLEVYRPKYDGQIARLRAMHDAIAVEDRHAPPTAVLRRGIAYRELMVRWIDSLLADLAAADLP